MPRLVPGRPMGKVVRTPPENMGSIQGMLFQIEKQLSEKKGELDRVKGDVAYLQRRKEKLERELLYRQGGETEKEASNETNTGSH